MTRRWSIGALLLFCVTGLVGGLLASAGDQLRNRALLRLGDERLHHRSSVQHVAFSPDGRLIAGAGINTERGVRLWDVHTGEQVASLVPDGENVSWVECFAFSPDGKLLLIGETGGYVALWDMEHRQLVYRERVHGRTEVSTVAFSSDGVLYASGGQDGKILAHTTARPGDVLWEFVSQERGSGGSRGFLGVPAESAAGDAVASLQFSPDGRHLYAGFGRSVSVVDLNAENGRPVRTIRRTHGIGSSSHWGFGSVALLPDGLRLLTSGFRTVKREEMPQGVDLYVKNVQVCELRVWDIATGQLAGDLTEGQFTISNGYASLSPDGRRIACGDFGKLQIRSAADGKVTRSVSLPGWSGSTPAFSPDGTLVAAGVDGTIYLWRVDTGERLFADRPGNASGVSAVSWSPDGRRLVTGSWDGRLNLWNAETAELGFADTLGTAAHLWDIDYAADGSRFAASGPLGDLISKPHPIVKVWSGDGKLVSTILPSRHGQGVALSPHGDRLVVAHSNGGFGDLRLELWQVDPPQKLAEFPRDPNKGLSRHKMLHFAPDGRFVHIAEYDGTVTRWDTSPAEEDRSFVADWRPVEQRTKKNSLWIGKACFSQNAELLVTSTNETLCLWDVTTGTLRGTITVPEAAHGFNIGLSPDGRTLATSDINYAGAPGTDVIGIFDLETGQVALTLSPGDARATSFAFSPDGKRLLTGLDNGTAIVWDLSR